MALAIKNLLVNVGGMRHRLDTWIWEDPLAEGMVIHSSILAGDHRRIVWSEEPGGLQPMGSQRVKHY